MANSDGALIPRFCFLALSLAIVIAAPAPAPASMIHHDYSANPGQVTK
jgi:hypothetical protein